MADGKLLFVSNSKSSEQPVFCLGMEKKKRLLRNWADKIDWEDRGLGARESARSPAGVLQLPGEPGLLLQHNLSQPNSNVSSLLQLC